MYENVILKIMDYIETNLSEPKKEWSREQFCQRSYERWSAYELLFKIMDHPMEPPETTVQEFMIEMQFFSRKSNDSEAFKAFHTAADIANDILEMICEEV